VKARILDVQWDKHGRLEALSEALRYEPNDPFLRHQYGVALSRVGREEDAIREFTLIIDQESKRVPLRETLIMSLTTRIINLRRLGRIEEARDDLRTARELVARYPQLTHSAIRLDELESENQG
jgi:tetratricopeptide (TPR) repeat protein